jgi:subtilase family serine protease
MCDWDVTSLGAGQVFQRTCSGSYGIPSASSPGHTVEMFVDDQSAVAESNESNNELSTYVPVQTVSSSVDLVAASLTWSPNPASQGDEVAITFTIRNDGSSAAGSFHVELRRDGAYMCDWIVNSLNPGNTFQRTCSGSYGIPSASAPGHTVEMFVDDQGAVAESNEGNNSRSVFVSVQ